MTKNTSVRKIELKTIQKSLKAYEMSGVIPMLEGKINRMFGFDDRYGDDKWVYRLMEAKSREERQAIWRSMAYRRVRLFRTRVVFGTCVKKYKDFSYSRTTKLQLLNKSHYFSTKEILGTSKNSREAIIFSYIDDLDCLNYQSLVFQQSLKLGISHGVLLRYFVWNVTKLTAVAHPILTQFRTPTESNLTLRGLANTHVSHITDQFTIESREASEKAYIHKLEYPRVYWEMRSENEGSKYLSSKNLIDSSLDSNSIPNIGYYGKYLAKQSDSRSMKYATPKLLKDWHYNLTNKCQSFKSFGVAYFINLESDRLAKYLL
jgi:hypothetical protein